MSERFVLTPAPLSGLTLVTRQPRGDARGYLERLWCADSWQALFGSDHIAQINHTHTALAGTVRGLHFQYPPYAESKYVSCLRGKVFDVAVDLRRDSPTFLQWHGEILSADNFCSLYIPAGFAHGFQALSDDCELLYLHSQPYHAEAEGGLDALDTRLAIRWPLPPGIRSARDAGFAPLDASFSGVSS